MSFKRSRATYEADLAAQSSSFVAFGTPLPPLDSQTRDDGSYVPVWKQEVRDERGRKRLHGAFTGGWSAGYFNTVGSKEGWTPSNFVSSRTNRRKDQPDVIQQRPEDFMDEEDLRDAEEARKIETSAAFAGLGSTEETKSRADALMGLFRPQGDTMGTKLLRKMGWKDGQGIGPRVRREARLDVKTVRDQKSDTFLFAPENVPMISLERKQDKKGLGYQGEPGLRLLGPSNKIMSAMASEDEEEDSIGRLGRPRLMVLDSTKKPGSVTRGGIGTGVLNATGSDDEDPYEIGPRISYNRVIGGDKKKKKTAMTAANPAVKKPAFLPNRSALKRVGLAIRRCQVSQKLSSLRVSTTGQDDQEYTLDNNENLPPLSPSRPRLMASKPYQHLRSIKDSRSSPEPDHGRTNRFHRSETPSPAQGLEIHHNRVRLEADDSPSQRISMERIRERVLADFKAGIVGCHYVYEDSDADTVFEGEDQEPEPISVSTHSDSRENPFDTFQLGDRQTSETPVETPLTPFPGQMSTSAHDWAFQPALAMRPHHNDEAEVIPDSPRYDEDVDCDCCGYQIEDDNDTQTRGELVPLIMPGDSGYISGPDRGPGKTPYNTMREEFNIMSPKRRMSIYDILCDPPFKRPKSSHKYGNCQASDEDTVQIVAPPSSPVMPLCDIDRKRSSSPDRNHVVEDWVMLNRLHVDDAHLDDSVLACASSVSFLDEIEARRVMMDSWDEELAEDFRRSAKEANREELYTN